MSNEEITWVCEYCGKKYVFSTREEYEWFTTIHREIHEISERCGIKIVWDEENKCFRGFSILTGKELYPPKKDHYSSMLV